MKKTRRALKSNTAGFEKNTAGFFFRQYNVIIAFDKSSPKSSFFLYKNTPEKPV
ncbi:hypothetical protein JCM10003_410 [Bacteroides pyogenes JCM 10003]|nr:hypothetical protein JCM10003_410 [Bacteroides pyogenes JCM 10003]